MLMNARSCCLKHLLSPSYLNEILGGFRSGSFIILWMCYHLYWPEEFLLKDQLLFWWGSNCMLFVFPLAEINVCFLCLNFQCLINMCFGSISRWVHPVWNSPVCWDSGSYFLPHLMEVLNFYLFKNFLKAHPFFLFQSSPFGHLRFSW